MNSSIQIRNLEKTYLIKKLNEKTVINELINKLKGKQRFEKFKALNNINLDIQPGDIVGVIGPNGAGKTTLLQIISGILKATSGEIKAEGNIFPIIDLGSDLNGELTGRENIFLIATVMGIPKKEIKNQYNEILKFSGLGKFINVKVKHYSNGMRLRLAFSLILLANPDILLIDEVFGVGDLEFQKKSYQKMKEYVDRKKTLLIATQDMGLIGSLCDKVLFLNKGKQIYFGTPSIAIEKYQKMDLTKTESKFEEWGPKDVEITKVKILSGGVETDSINIADDMILEISYNNKKNIAKPMFGIALYNRENMIVFGPNTTISKFNTSKLPKKGTLQLVIKSIPFVSGKYALTVAAHSYDGTKLYHRLEKFKSFFVNLGLKKDFSEVEYEWRLK